MECGEVKVLGSQRGKVTSFLLPALCPIPLTPLLPHNSHMLILGTSLHPVKAHIMERPRGGAHVKNSGSKQEQLGQPDMKKPQSPRSKDESSIMPGLNP